MTAATDTRTAPSAGPIPERSELRLPRFEPPPVPSPLVRTAAVPVPARRPVVPAPVAPAPAVIAASARAAAPPTVPAPSAPAPSPPVVRAPVPAGRAPVRLAPRAHSDGVLGFTVGVGLLVGVLALIVALATGVDESSWSGGGGGGGSQGRGDHS